MSKEYKVVMTGKFRKDLKRLQKQHRNINKIMAVVEMLKTEEFLPQEFKEHKLSGDYSGFSECHVELDLLLVYKKEADILVLTLARTGSHSELF